MTQNGNHPEISKFNKNRKPAISNKAFSFDQKKDKIMG